MTGYGARSALSALILLLLCLSGLQALEVEQGDIRLVLHEGSGRFSLYGRAPAPGRGFAPLFVDQDPRTSGTSLVVNNRIYKLGDSAEFSEKVESGAGRARFLWESKTVRVVQEFEPIVSAPSAAADGVRMSIRISNLTRNKISVGLRLCLDTYLGEESLSHFATDRHQDVGGELTISRDSMVSYWISAPASPGIGLKCLTSGSGIVSPDRIVFANWKRLSEASWSYETSRDRNFNLLPYSINDSAVCLYYDPVTLPALGSHEITLVLGNLSITDRRLPAAGEAAAGEGGLKALSAQAGQPAELPQATAAALLQDLDLLNRLLREIESKLSSAGEITDEDIRLMENILSDIKDRSERYSGDN